jgi:putative redox protein
MHHVEVSNSGDYSFRVNSGDYQFSVDTKGEKGVRPSDTLLASLGACVGVYIRKYAEGAKLSIPGFKINVQAEFSKESPICFKKIEIAINLEGAVLEERRLKSMLEFVKKCPVHNTLKNNPEVEIKIK